MNYASGRSARAARARQRWTEQQAPFIHATMERYRCEGLFLSPSDVEFVQQSLQRVEPKYRQQVLKRAETVFQHRLSVLGYGEVDLGRPINWHRDPVHNYGWPLSYALTMDFVRPHDWCDVKVPWEISRLQFLAWLGEAFCMTQEERYFEKFRSLLAAWSEANPVGYGVNWTCAMEVAIRGCNILFASQLFRDRLDGPFADFVYALLWDHAQFIRRHLEDSDVRGNHYLADVVGLVQLSAFLEPAPEAVAWRRWATDELFREILGQFHPDGVHHEHAIGYHRLTLEMVLPPLLLLRRRGTPVPADVEARIRAALKFVECYTFADGGTPAIGDADDGRILWFGEQSTRDHRYLLLLGAALDESLEFSHQAVPLSPAAAWYLDRETLERVSAQFCSDNAQDAGERVQPAACRAGVQSFAHGGFHVLAAGTTQAVVRCGRLGLRGRGSHDHNDQLSFCLFFNGASLLIDSGCHAYTLSKTTRHETLSSYAHNTLVIDRREQAEFAAGSVMESISRAAEGTAVSPDGGTCFAGYHDGYARLSGVGRHTRQIELSADGLQLTCTDRVDGSGEHDVELLFHLSSECALTACAGSTAQVSTPGGRVEFLVDGCGLHAERRDGWLSAAYGHRQPATLLVFQNKVRLPATVRTTIRNKEGS